MITPEDIVITHKRNKQMEDVRADTVRQLEFYLEGMKVKHELNLQLLLDNPVGVAEHPDIVATIEGELSKVAEYKDKLSALRDLGW